LILACTLRRRPWRLHRFLQAAPLLVVLVAGPAPGAEAVAVPREIAIQRLVENEAHWRAATLVQLHDLAQVQRQAADPAVRRAAHEELQQLQRSLIRRHLETGVQIARARGNYRRAQQYLAELAILDFPERRLPPRRGAVLPPAQRPVAEPPGR